MSGAKVAAGKRGPFLGACVPSDRALESVKAAGYSPDSWERPSREAGSCGAGKAWRAKGGGRSLRGPEGVYSALQNPTQVRKEHSWLIKLKAALRSQGGNQTSVPLRSPASFFVRIGAPPPS